MRQKSAGPDPAIKHLLKIVLCVFPFIMLGIYFLMKGPKELGYVILIASMVVESWYIYRSTRYMRCPTCGDSLKRDGAAGPFSCAPCQTSWTYEEWPKA